VRCRSDDHLFPEHAAPAHLLSLSNTPLTRVRTSPWAERFARLKTVGAPDGTKLAKQVFEDMIDLLD
jgi:hypothetical protein